MRNNHKAIIELHYMPSTVFLAVWQHFDQVIIESKEKFKKQTFRNRCRILTANKIESLIVPVQKASNNIPIQEIRIDYNQNWVHTHWKSIQSAYGNAPFFEHYGQELNDILYKKHRFLFDLNLEILKYILSVLNIEKDLLFTQNFIQEYPSDVTDLRTEIHPKKNLEPIAFYQPVIQVFGKQFVENLSVIDLIFNEGPNAGEIINRSIHNELNK